MLYIAGKLRTVITYLLFGKVAYVEFLVGIGFHIVGWRGFTQYHGAGIFLFFGLESVYLFSEFSGADDEQARRQWVECAGMAHF